MLQDQEGRPPRTNGTLHAKEVNQGQDYIAETNKQPSREQAQTEEDIATGNVTEAILLTYPHPETDKDCAVEAAYKAPPHTTTQYYQDNLNTLHIRSLETP